MLLSFRFANHRSFRDDQELLLLPAYDKSLQAVPVTGIYGANASGKSGVLLAIATMRKMVLESFSRWSPLSEIPREPFAFDSTALARESTFGVDLLLNGEKYVYGFSVDDAKVTEEWLYHYPRGSRRILFERNDQKIDFGDSLRGPKKTVKDITRPNSLFLSAAAQHGLKQILPVFAWFGRSIRTLDQTSSALGSWEEITESLRDPVHARKVLSLLRAADLGISGVQIRPPQPPSQEKLPSPREVFGLDVENRKNSPRAVISMDAFSRVRTLTGGDIAFVRDTPDGPVPLPLTAESQGTLTWLRYLATLIEVLEHGRLLLADEFDGSLHPLLVRQFIRLFQNPRTNPHGAQLLFTTHDSTLLGRHQGEELLRRDEIWFTEKEPDGASKLYPLTDFKPREGLNWERRYLGGSVGAVPFLDEAAFEKALATLETPVG